MITDFKRPVENIRRELKDYIMENKLKSLVAGVSGGIDSALCCVLAGPVCCDLNIPLIGRSIFIETNREEEMERAAGIGECFCDDFREVDLTDEYRKVADMLGAEGADDLDDFRVKVRYGNVKARIRMIYLYDLAQRKGGMVLSTDNRTELMVGFWTLHGDVGDYGMIQNLWKTEVYGMASYLASEFDSGDKKYRAIMDCIGAVPTDGLGITSSDLEQLKVDSYAEADRILIEYIEEGRKENEEHPIIQRYKRTEFKRRNPYNIPREMLIK